MKPHKKIRSNIEKIHLIFSFVIRLTILFALVGAVMNSRWTVLFVGSLAFIFTFLPSIIERNYKVSLPHEFEIMIVIFIYSALFLGEVHGYYTRFWWWDVVLHTGSGLLLGLLGFIILFILYEGGMIKGKPITIAMFSFCFALAIGALWEIFEFSMDQAIGLNMQNTGLIDTMWDLIIDAAGALLISVLGFIYLKGGKTRVFSGFLKKFIDENPNLFLKDRT